MSADNGIYIARFLEDDDGTHTFQYRVAHAQAIENCNYEGYEDIYRVLIFGSSKVFTKDDAWKKARQLTDEIMESDFPILEYGVQMLRFDVPFPKMTIQEAQRRLDQENNLQNISIQN